MWNITLESIVIGCDGLNALHQGLDVDSVRITSKKHQFDLLSGMQGYIRDSSVIYIYQSIAWAIKMSIS